MFTSDRFFHHLTLVRLLVFLGLLSGLIIVFSTAQATPLLPVPLSQGGCRGGFSAEAIDAYLRCKHSNSPLIGYGATFMQAGQRHNVDPRFVVAIAGAESTFGTRGDCVFQHRNAWGYGGGWPSCWNFASWEAAIEQVTMDIGRYYLPQGQNNIPSFVIQPAGTCVSHCWCASSCTHWIGNVKQFYSEQGGNPDTEDLTFRGNAGSASPATGYTSPPGYTFCAWENERCNFSGTADVAYGANGSFAYRERVSGGIDCNNGIFGDPAYGVRKACYIRRAGSGQPDYTPPAGYTFCAWENERCNFSGTADVAYGANGRFAYRQTLSGGVDCSNGVFGDPVAGVRKACFTRATIALRCAPRVDQTALFVDPGFTGQCVTRGYGDYRNPGAIGLPNDSLSSLSVGPDVQVVLCEHDDYGGVCETFTANDDNLADNRIGNDRVSSLRVERRGSPVPADCPGQYRVAYYTNRSLSGNPILVRCEGWPIRHDWAGGSPGSGVPDDGFSVQWIGRARFDAGSYTFIARADDGIRVWLDDSLIIDAWRDQGPTEYRATRNVSAGEHGVRVEYYENGGGALAEFRWERAASAGGCNGQEISPEQRVEGRLSNAVPSISYCLRGAAGQMISARMFFLGNDSLDPFLKVWAPDGRLLAENDDGLGIGTSSFLSVRLPRDGVYRVEATRYGSTEGRYALRVERGFQAAVGDLDRDCDVDRADRDRLMSVLGRADDIADLDLDGVVSTRDALFQSRNMGVRCN